MKVVRPREKLGLQVEDVQQGRSYSHSRHKAEGTGTLGNVATCMALCSFQRYHSITKIYMLLGRVDIVDTAVSSVSSPDSTLQSLMWLQHWNGEVSRDVRWCTDTT